MNRLAVVAFLIICVIFFVLIGFSSTQKEISPTISEPTSSAPDTGASDVLKENIEELRACWFSYLEWESMLSGKSEDEFKTIAKQICDNLVSIGCNTLILQLRAFGDAMYQSELFPISKYCAGILGKSLDYDPLQLFLDAASEAGLSIHGWINPMRTMTDDEFAQISDEYQLKQWYLSENQSDYYMKDGSGRYILNPANPKVRDFIVSGVLEIVNKYQLDGIHLDDYFYPSGVDGLSQNDNAYYQKQNPGVDIGDWRRDATSQLVKQLYQTVHEANGEMVFGISPQANFSNNYNKMYIDVNEWLSEDGYVDYIMPQIYYGFENSTLPFDQAANQWNALIQNDTILYVGLAAYKLGMENDVNAGAGCGEWKTVSQNGCDILCRQEEYLRTLSHYQGYCLYSYKSLFLPDGTVNPGSSEEIANLNALFY